MATKCYIIAMWTF